MKSCKLKICLLISQKHVQHICHMYYIIYCNLVFASTFAESVDLSLLTLIFACITHTHSPLRSHTGGKDHHLRRHLLIKWGNHSHIHSHSHGYAFRCCAVIQITEQEQFCSTIFNVLMNSKQTFDGIFLCKMGCDLSVALIDLMQKISGHKCPKKQGAPRCPSIFIIHCVGQSWVHLSCLYPVRFLHEILLSPVFLPFLPLQQPCLAEPPPPAEPSCGRRPANTSASSVVWWLITNAEGSVGGSTMRK